MHLHVHSVECLAATCKGFNVGGTCEYTCLPESRIASGAQKRREHVGFKLAKFKRGWLLKIVRQSFSTKNTLPFVHYPVIYFYTLSICGPIWEKAQLH